MATVEITALTNYTNPDRTQDVLPIVNISGNQTQKITTNNLLGITGAPLGTSDSQTISNKTLGNTNALTLLDGSFTLQNTGSTTRQANFSVANIPTSSTVTFILPNPSASSDTLVTLDANQTLANKTFTGGILNSPSIVDATLTADTISGYSSANSGQIYGISVSGGQIGPAALAPGAITLGKLVYTTSQTSFTGTTVTAMTGMSLTVTIPSSGRVIRVSVLIPNIVVSGGSTIVYISIWDGTVGVGTQLQEVAINPAAASAVGSAYAFALVTPSAGSKTYNIGWRISANSTSTQLGSTVPSIIQVEAL